MAYVTREALQEALVHLKGTSDHLIKIWFTLKQMGMTVDNSVIIDTMSSTKALKDLFDFGDPSGSFYVPFAHTKRFLTMKSDASRSIIQTNVKRWQASGSVVTVDPTSYLEISPKDDDSLEVRPKRIYPLGLGFGRNGFALEDNSRVSIPILAFGVWYYRQSEFPNDPNAENIVSALTRQLQLDLNLTIAEIDLIFVADQPTWKPSFQSDPLPLSQIFNIVTASIESEEVRRSTNFSVLYPDYVNKVNAMTTIPDGPSWLNQDPKRQLQRLLEGGATIVLLYGPPRTGKTMVVDQIFPRNSESRETIQIHDGWGYDELIIGLRPQPDGSWRYVEGPLLLAIRNNKRCIVLEEINRTEFSQAIGEVFSLVESKYRGSENKIRLRDGSDFFIPSDTILVFTMNTLDRSTEDIDDALFERVDAVEFGPRVEELHGILQDRGIDGEMGQNMRELFAFIQPIYPLGHGYFSAFSVDTNPINYYLSRIRPVLQKHLKDYRDNDLASVDEKVNQLFGSK